MFPCEFCEVSKNAFFYRTLPVAASKNSDRKPNSQRKCFVLSPQILGHMA